MDKFDIIIQLGFDIYAYYKHNNYNINTTRKHFKKILKKELNFKLEILFNEIEKIHKNHLQFKNNLNELNITYITLKEKDFEKIYIKDGVFRYISLIETFDVKLIKYLYSLIHKDTQLSSVSELIILFRASFSLYNGLNIIGLETAKPILRKILINKEKDFNECSVCLETISFEKDNQGIFPCVKCCNILCYKCCNIFKDCPVCHNPFHIIKNNKYLIK